MKKLVHSTWECNHGRLCWDKECDHRGNHPRRHLDCEQIYLCQRYTRHNGVVTKVRCNKFKNGKIVP